MPKILVPLEIHGVDGMSFCKVIQLNYQLSVVLTYLVLVAQVQSFTYERLNVLQTPF